MVSTRKLDERGGNSRKKPSDIANAGVVRVPQRSTVH